MQARQISARRIMRQIKPVEPGEIDREALAADLRKRIQGEVRFDNGSRALYSMDASNYRHIPIGVVIPRTIEDVLETLEAARRFGAPILARGGGTSLAGQCCNFGVVIDMSKYLNRIVEVDPQRKVARIQPGVVPDQLNREIEQYKLMYGPDPATHAYCTFGGMIGNNSCGVHSVIAGRTSDNIESLDVLTYDGERFEAGKTGEIELQRLIQNGGRRGQIYSSLKILRDKYADTMRQRFPKIPRRSSGYNFDELHALVHGHCHHKSIMKMDAEEKALKGLGLHYELPDSDCCGMAGAFGFEDKHYDISMKCGERVLLPKVREAAKNTLIIADGFSCREQIKSGTDRRALHLAQVIQMAMEESSFAANYSEKRYVRANSTHKASPLMAAAGISGAIAFIVLLKRCFWPGARRKRDSAQPQD